MPPRPRGRHERRRVLLGALEELDPGLDVQRGSVGEQRRERVGLAAAAAFAGALPVALLLSTLAAAAAGIALGALAGFAPAVWLRRVSVVAMLADE